MRAVVDTNILVRALIRPQGAAGPIITRLLANDYTPVYSAPMRDELIATLGLPRIRRKYGVADLQVEALFDLLALRGDFVVPTRTVKVCRDPNDDMLITNLEVSVAG